MIVISHPPARGSVALPPRHPGPDHRHVHDPRWSLSQGILTLSSQPLRRRFKFADHDDSVTGFLAYFVSNLAFYYSPEIRAQYAARHRGLEPTVQFNDITFALHALILSIVTVSQYLFSSLWNFTPSPGNRPSRFILGVAAGCITGVVLTCVIVTASAGNDPLYDWVALDIVYAIGYVKLIVTLIKYTPQIVANYNNQSTEGWSISQILLDLTGGVLSVSQQAIDSYQQRDWSGITGNPVKFALGNISMIYDSIFITQHYVLYRNKPHHAHAEGERLLDEERRV